MEPKKKDKTDDIIHYVKKNKIYKKWWFWLIAIIIVGVLSRGFAQSENDYNKSVEVTNSTKQNEQKTSLNDAIEKAADPHFGKITSLKVNDDMGKNDGGKIVMIHVKQDGLTKNTVDFNTARALEKVFKINKVNEITYFWEATLVDTKGNESTETVDKIQMKKETAKTINWKNFDHTNLEKVADQYNASPVLK